MSLAVEFAPLLQQESEESKCSICHEQLKLTEAVGHFGATVFHGFHSGCINEWFQTKDEQALEHSCPVCRFNIGQLVKANGQLVPAGRDAVRPNEIRLYTPRLNKKHLAGSLVVAVVGLLGVIIGATVAVKTLVLPIGLMVMFLGLIVAMRALYDMCRPQR